MDGDEINEWWHAFDFLLAKAWYSYIKADIMTWRH